jgi:hypothetical protein
MDNAGMIEVVATYKTLMGLRVRINDYVDGCQTQSIQKDIEHQGH